MFEVGDRVRYSDFWLESCRPEWRRNKYAVMSGAVIRIKGESYIVKWDTLKSPVILFADWLVADTEGCPLCYGHCDPEIHTATVAVHAWFREQVTLGLTPVIAGKRAHG